jgi:hypothetical protein
MINQLACPKCLSVDIEIYHEMGCGHNGDEECEFYGCNECNLAFDEPNYIPYNEPDDYDPVDGNDRFDDDY